MAFAQTRAVQQKTADGALEGSLVSADGKVRTFKGIPFAGAARWPAALEGAAACHAVDGRPTGQRVRRALHAGQHLLGRG